MAPIPTTPALHDIDANGRSPGIGRLVATQIDLRHARRLVYVGGEGGVLVALLDAWPALTGAWLGPLEAQADADDFIRWHGLQTRVRSVAANRLDSTTAGDLVVVNASDEAADPSLQCLVNAGGGWLAANGKLLLLQRDRPNGAGAVGLPQLHQLQLRVTSQWLLPDGVRLLVCAPAHDFLWAVEGLAGPAATAGVHR